MGEKKKITIENSKDRKKQRQRRRSRKKDKEKGGSEDIFLLGDTSQLKRVEIRGIINYISLSLEAIFLRHDSAFYTRADAECFLFVLLVFVGLFCLFVCGFVYLSG